MESNEPNDGEPTMDELLGLHLLETDREEMARGRMRVTNRVRQPDGFVHGGAYAALAEAVVSAATMNAVRDAGMIALGRSNHTDFLRPASEGAVHARASRKHRGRSAWIWDVELTDDDGRLCALSRITVAIRPQLSEPRRALGPGATAAAVPIVLSGISEKSAEP